MQLTLWFVKSKRAQTSDDDETWLRGGVAPTLNAFDMGDTRATVIVLMREREGKAGGGKGFLLAEDKAFTLATSNFHTVFLFEATRVDDVRIYENYSPTVATYWGTGGARVPYRFDEGEMVAVRRLTPTECERLQGFPDGWTDGQADSHRYKQMGNAVAVPVVEWIINRIIK
jgi:site-specific DNA-cytosine methylase